MEGCIIRALLIVLFCLGCWYTGGALWLLGKAQLAQYLIASAWQRGDQSSPWPWADTRAVLRLRVAELDQDLYVLDGHHGQALAFGPGLQRSADGSTRVIAGHRDSHFGFLEQMQPGMAISLETAAGQQLQYRVLAVSVFDSRLEALPAARDGLLLVTCYPFAAASAGGPLRWVVHAVKS